MVRLPTGPLFAALPVATPPTASPGVAGHIAAVHVALRSAPLALLLACPRRAALIWPQLALRATARLTAAAQSPVVTAGPAASTRGTGGVAIACARAWAIQPFCGFRAPSTLSAPSTWPLAAPPPPGTLCWWALVRVGAGGGGALDSRPRAIRPRATRPRAARSFPEQLPVD